MSSNHLILHHLPLLPSVFHSKSLKSTCHLIKGKFEWLNATKLGSYVLKFIVKFSEYPMIYTTTHLHDLFN